MQPSDHNLIWLDLEMTGLNTFSDEILEIAVIVTGPQLEIVAEGPSLAIRQPEGVLARMDKWNQKHHSKSGLLKEVRDSRITYAEAETQVLKFLECHAVAGKSPMCGSSICQDRRFLARLMPRLEKFFHYRNLDVSTLKELAVRWMPEAVITDKQNRHRALDDVRDSIKELKHYRSHIMKC